jgi:hypothetical protein
VSQLRRLRAQPTCYTFSEVAGHESCTSQKLIMRVTVGVAGLSCFSGDLLLRILDQKGLVTRVDKAVGWNVKPSPRHMELPLCSGVSLHVS